MKCFIVIICLATFYSCNEKIHEGFSLSGKIEDGAGRTVYLDIVGESKIEKFDSALIDEESFFSIKNHVDDPELFILKFDDNNFIYLFIDSTDQITVNANAVNLLTSCKVEGSENSILLQQLSLHNYRSRLRVDSLNRIYNSLRTTANLDSLKKSLDSVYFEIYSNERNFLIGFIEKNPSSLSSIIALYQQIAPKTFVLNPENPVDLKYFEQIDNNLFKLYPNSVHVKALHSQIIEVKRRIEAMNSPSQLNQNGSEALEIAEPDTNGDTIRLSSLRGKYVLLDFWASWCAPCRQENPNLVANYNKYKSKGFEIYSVSLDKDKNAWIKAIKDDKLNWVHVSDLKFWSSYPAMLYKVQSVPANFLIDPDGKIIAQNLRGGALGSKLSEIFDK
ncbi:MAG: TlpA disulfide reductase family protein [Bacteroidota bacterium]